MPARRGRIVVIAGVNGAGKSSVAGATLRASGTGYFNPDEATLHYLHTLPGITLSAANAAAWMQGKRMLERAITERGDFAFETTLGGSTITRLLEAALDAGMDVQMRYVGLESVELHLARVRARVAAGGHDIPEAKIRERYVQSRLNVIRLLPRLTDLMVFDNSREAPPLEGKRPKPELLLHTAGGTVLEVAPLQSIPTWAKPIVMAALGR
jgi:predicted ABC-type ATPase